MVRAHSWIGLNLISEKNGKVELFGQLLQARQELVELLVSSAYLIITRPAEWKAEVCKDNLPVDAQTARRDPSSLDL